ncbi:MAG: peroxide stress protein YaaA [Nitrososphaerota archaeon]|nr:YaaA family protein [Aigarchaeota archaeon]MDW8076506.1 peroxide stress protein YaaA [Nitrososphaerota archaeon]
MKGKTLILIPCCGSKNPGGFTIYNGKRCIANYLSVNVGKRLMELRRHVAIAFGERLGPDVGVEVLGTQISYMKAYERYCGNLYSKISKSSWEKLNDSQNLSLVIVSAFYGILRHDELIRNYNRAMNKDRVDGVLLKTWWSRQGLCDILLDYIIKNRIETVHDFLSINYSEAIWPFPSKVRELGINYFMHDYPGLGSGSDFYRGKDVYRLIQTF